MARCLRRLVTQTPWPYATARSPMPVRRCRDGNTAGTIKARPGVRIGLWLAASAARCFSFLDHTDTDHPRSPTPGQAFQALAADSGRERIRIPPQIVWTTLPQGGRTEAAEPEPEPGQAVRQVEPDGGQGTRPARKIGSAVSAIRCVSQARNNNHPSTHPSLLPSPFLSPPERPFAHRAGSLPASCRPDSDVTTSFRT